jgi:surface antigen
MTISSRKLAVVIGAAMLVSLQPVTVSAQEHWRGHDHRGWDRGGPAYAPDHWRRGLWQHGRHDGRDGWWWVVGGLWHWYPTPVNPYPQPVFQSPPVIVGPPGQLLYYCGNPSGYYPQVPACLIPWQMVQSAPQPIPAPIPQAMPMQIPMGPSSSSGMGIDQAVGGAMLGAIGGGFAGAQFGHGSGNLAATAIGTLLGAFIGHQVGESLNRADALAATSAERNAYQAQIGQTISWNNPETGHSGAITPIRDGRDSSGNYCRAFEQSVMVDGRSEQASGTACRQPDGSWRVVSP